MASILVFTRMGYYRIPCIPSHFLRNIGYDDYAIIDFHIIDILTQYGFIKKPKSLSKKRYLEIEQDLNHIAQLCDLTLAELDFYLWYLETGKILK